MKTRNLLSRLYRAEGEEAGASAAPVAPAAPADTSGSAPAGGDSPAVNEWEGYADDSDSNAGDAPAVVDTPSTPPVTPAASPDAPVQPSVAAPAAEPQPAQQPAAEPAAPQADAQQPVDIKAIRDQYEKDLTAYYAIDAETAQRLQTEPENVLPQLAARVHLEVLDTIMAQLPNRMQSILSHINTYEAREREASDVFFTAYPDLKEHKDAVLRVGQMYRAANPTATKEQAVKAIGDFVRTSLGLSAPAPVVQQAPPIQPFTPAGGSGNGAPPAEVNPWMELASTDD